MPVVPWSGVGGGAKKLKASGNSFKAVHTTASEVRVRECAPKDGDFPSALHCHHLLDALLEDLPKDATHCHWRSLMLELQQCLVAGR
jgi:hypothetical protein